jgi:hypothetical protein
MSAVLFSMFYFALLTMLGVIYGTMTLYYIICELVEYIRYRKNKIKGDWLKC